MLQQWCARSQLSLNSQKMAIIPFIQKQNKGPEETNPLDTHTTADYCSQITWTYSGQGTDIEDTGKKCYK